MADNTHQLLPVLVSNRHLASTEEPQWAYQPYQGVQQEENAVPVSHYLWVLKRYRWRVLCFVLGSVLATLLISSRLTPYYESTATVDIDRQVRAAAIGDEANVRTGTEDADQFLATQVRLIGSDSVLRPVVKRLGIPAAPVKAQNNSKVNAEEAPVSLPGLKITRLPNTYLLLVTYRSPDPRLAASVANGIVQSYIEHAFKIRFQASAGLSAFMEQQTGELKQKMERSSSALVKFEKDLNVIDPEAKTSILSSRLLQLNSELTTAQANRIDKESAYRSIKDGNLEAAQASQQGDQLRALNGRLDEQRAKFASIKVYYGDKHPEYARAHSELVELERQRDLLRAEMGKTVAQEYRQAVSREAMLKSALGEAKAEFDTLNAHSFDYKALKQEADSNKKIYEEMIRRIEEEGINASFRDNSIRLADPARPSMSPAFPNLKLNALMAFLCSGFVAVLAAIAWDHMDQTVRDPDQIQRVLKTQVLGYLPTVTSWRTGIPNTSDSPSMPMLRARKGSRQSLEYEDAMRTLRDSVLLPTISHRLHSLLFTSSTPREGKTVTAVQFAVAHSKQGRRTLLIDGDIRRPRVHQHFGVSNAIGLSTVVDGQASWRDAVQAMEGFPNLSILPAGHYSNRALDCIGPVIREVIEEASDEFELVILDSPPVLGFAEPLQMAALVDGVVVVALAGETNRTAVASTLSGLRRVGANILGIALNQVHADVGGRYYHYGYRGKYYNRYYTQNQEQR